MCVSRWIAWRRIHPTMGQSDVCDTNVGWIKRSGSTNVGRLREASRQKRHRRQNWPLCVSRRIA
nr:hypothetical protein [Methylomarinum sp. Ch1-1]MDP4519764.1 hypothetical protein [Methylomarinum sp. Ch1-1]